MKGAVAMLTHDARRAVMLYYNRDTQVFSASDDEVIGNEDTMIM